jgi:hypothetical protein
VIPILAHGSIIQNCCQTKTLGWEQRAILRLAIPGAHNLDMMNSWALTYLKGVDFFRIAIEG